MIRYCLRDFGNGVNDVGNLITLRGDIQHCLDSHDFVFYPVDDNKLMTYVVRPGVDDYAELLHRRLVTLPRRVSAEFVYARFAYTVINLLQSSHFDEYPIPDNVKLAENARSSAKKGRTSGHKAKEPKHSTVYATMCSVHWLTYHSTSSYARRVRS